MSYPNWIDRYASVNLREVAPNLYVGASESPDEDIPWVHVIDLTREGRETPLRSYPGTHIPFEDGSAIPRMALQKSLSIVSQNRPLGPVLIHCRMGLSRSPSMAYVMLCLLDRLSHEEALARVKAHPDYPMPRTLASARRFVTEF